MLSDDSEDSLPALAELTITTTDHLTGEQDKTMSDLMDILGDEGRYGVPTEQVYSALLRTEWNVTNAANMIRGTPLGTEKPSAEIRSKETDSCEHDNHTKQENATIVATHGDVALRWRPFRIDRENSTSEFLDIRENEPGEPLPLPLLCWPLDLQAGESRCFRVCDDDQDIASDAADDHPQAYLIKLLGSSDSLAVKSDL
ncbi:hypothetical protein LTS18_000438 [Coniosporium uncinatum]|uniref:Uncharacterized protein n=1 Tax=Coniosporium uncinatum TaxID=93489 RepID=A0ACC3D898_9PEZI|nr:hypothetical protein LTS18_000438 [Coniosporium uncinatum]